jgi:tetratricopeptide (TPR) repeat protein
VSGTTQHYVKLGLFSVALAAAIAGIAAWMMPLDDEDPGGLDTADEPAAADATPLTLAATIQLPDAPVPVTTEALRDELVELGQQLREQFPQDPAALHGVALLYKDLQKTAEAERIWEACVALEPRQPGPYVGLASARMELGRDPEAVATLREALQAGHKTFEVYLQLGEALTKLAQLEEAADMLQRAVDLDPRSPQGWLQLGQVQLQLQQFEEAEASLQKALQLGTTSPSVYFALATVAARQGNQEQASRFREEFAKRNKDDSPMVNTTFQDRYDAELRRIAVAALCRAGTVVARQDQPDDAESLFLRALELDPANPVVCAELATFYRAQGRVGDARLAQGRLVTLDPGHAMHHANLASLASQMGDTRTAESSLRMVIQLRPDLAIGYLGLAQLYLQQDDLEQARYFAETAARQTTASAEERLQTLVVLVEVCQQQGDDEAAEKARAEADAVAASIQGAPGPDAAVE